MWGADGEKDGGKSEVIIKNYVCTCKYCQGKQSSQKGSLKKCKTKLILSNLFKKYINILFY